MNNVKRAGFSSAESRKVQESESNPRPVLLYIILPILV